ncbi:MAG: glutamate 5-kinase [Thiotrichales bacterium]|jgi:glutamate 5-kinase|nr:glutamate 5-kinase [Thiotrichales bacterium]MBT3614268.1 glutamate 5-kinase [Thiotrichales bacterium]MBT3752283.1 glutamate 5-kinase [Thiotrichales bacterium]MBT3837191.1 glutamate 5-kinase [Thiotrichales bacterium]MBT4152831.1 glutamate 5-kinase [Thiotrichales bacterium]
MKVREGMSEIKRCVIKLGSAIVTNGGAGLALDSIKQWAEQVVKLRQDGVEVVVVSSGAIAEGMQRLGMEVRPQEIHQQQAAAAVGQSGLVHAYESCFAKAGLQTAQILLTHDDVHNSVRFLNAKNSINTLLKMGVVPVVNENDTVATDELRLGDNDTLAALVSNVIDADLLIILTDQNGMYNGDPRNNPDAELLTKVDVTDKSLDKMAGGSAGELGRGGMSTKLEAARIASSRGAKTIVANGLENQILLRLLQGEQLGTLFV